MSDHCKKWRGYLVRFSPPALLLISIYLTTPNIFPGSSTLAQTSTSGNDGWVVLPVSEYVALRRAAQPPDAEPVPPPVEATLSRIDYDLKVDGDLASGEARLTVDVIKEGWLRLALPQGLLIRDAKLDGQPVTLVTHPADKGPGIGELLLSKTGRSILTLKIVAQGK
jgi:hypothetical protein